MRQNNGTGSAIWAVAIQVFIIYYGIREYELKMKTPLSTLALNMAGCGFVDNTDIIQLGLDDDNDYWTVARKLQEAFKWWEVCTKVSGRV